MKSALPTVTYEPRTRFKAGEQDPNVCERCGWPRTAHEGRQRLCRAIGLVLVRVDVETIAWLNELARCVQHLPEGADAAEVLAELARTAAEGCERPGAWERAWLQSAFMFEREPGLSPATDTPWRRRPPVKR